MGLIPRLRALTPLQRAAAAGFLASSPCDCLNCCRWRHASHYVRNYPEGNK